MGNFIENLRHKRGVRAQREVERILTEARKKRFERDRVLQVRAENKAKWEKAKGQFDESGLLGILNGVIEEKGAESKYIDPENFDELILWKRDTGRSYYHSELHINEIKKNSGYLINGGYKEKTISKFISIDTDKNGTISFRGSLISGEFNPCDGFFMPKLINVPITIRVPKTKWEKDRDVLEKALDKIYHFPRLGIDREIVDSPYFDSFAIPLANKIIKENKEPEA